MEKEAAIAQKYILKELDLINKLSRVHFKKALAAEIEAALTGDWRVEYIFELRQRYELYKYYHQKTDGCDEEIKKLLTTEIERNQKEEGLPIVADVKVKKKKARKNEANINIACNGRFDRRNRHKCH